MKKIALIIFFLSILNVHAQLSLPDSRRRSGESYIYTISESNLSRIYLKNDPITEDMLKKQVAKFTKMGDYPSLKRGNYVIVEAVENQLSFTDYTVDDLYYKVVPAEKLMLCLYDSMGNIITDAVVKCGSKMLRFDSKTLTYNTKKVKDVQIVEINNKGVRHYIEIEKQEPYHDDDGVNVFGKIGWKVKTIWYEIKEKVHYIFYPDDKPEENKYIGFIVFSKPKYKPGETVKLKAYMAEHNGKPYSGDVDLRLYNYYPYKVDTMLVKGLRAYRPGMFEYQFKLTDSLHLSLDNNYTIYIEPEGDGNNDINERFGYEEYELKSTHFSITTDKEEYAGGDTVNITLHVSDENHMAVYGGKAEIYVTPQKIYDEEKNKIIFVPDTLWRYDVDMADVSEKTITLPDSIFPCGASLSYKVDGIYLSADNEKETASKTLSWRAEDYIIDFSLSKGMLTVRQLHKGKSQPVQAEIRISGENGETISEHIVALPHTLPVPWYATGLKAETKEATDYYYFDEDGFVGKKHQLGHKLYRRNGLLYLEVDNPAQIPFWYTVRRGKNEVASGYATSLNHSMPDNGKNGYSMQLSYLMAGKSWHIDEILPYTEKNITMDITTPTSVYPGQKTNVLVSVADKNGNPVKNVDITAYSFTSKFGNYSMPSLPVKGKTMYAKPYRNLTYTSKESDFIDRNGYMTWNKWKMTMALDTIEYYRFLYPETLYRYVESTSDGSTQISPYVVIDGALQGVYMLWIDEKLYYTNLTRQMNVYTFQVEPGKHNLRIRTFDREIRIHNVWVDEGAKNILSFDAGKTYSRIDCSNDEDRFVISSRLLDKDERGVLSDKDMNYLSSQLITIDNNFGTWELPNTTVTFDAPAYIRSGNTVYDLNRTKRSNYNYTLRASVNAPVLVGPFPTRNFMNGWPDMASVYAGDEWIGNIGIEGGNRYTLYRNYQKIKDWEETPFSNTFVRYTPVADFRQELLTPGMIDRHFEETWRNSLCTLMGTAITLYGKELYEKVNTARLNITLGRDKKGVYVKPALILILPQKEKDIANYKLFYGGTRNFKNLPQGDVKISLIFNDSTSYTKKGVLSPCGENYLNIDSIDYEYNSEMAKAAFGLLNRNINKILTQNPYADNRMEADSVVYAKDDYGRYNDDNNTKGGTVSGMVVDSDGEPLIGVTVMIEGTTNETVTGLDGRFRLAIRVGDRLKITYLGFVAKTIKYPVGTDCTIVLEEDSQVLQDVVVVGYGVKKKTDVSAVSIYDDRIVNEVITIEDTALSAKTAGGKADSEAMDARHRMRRNFHDDAFWQPRLKTDEKGEASFEVTYPDDITNWNAYFIAIGNKDQTDRKQMAIKSFKALTARLAVPRFAVRGDSLNVVGRIVNYLGDSIDIARRIEMSGQAEDDSLRLASSHVDRIPVRARIGDSLTMAYSLQMENGYFDGEERTIPIFEQGMLQTHGDFRIINDTGTHQLSVDPSLGAVTVYAEASSLELFLREIDKVDKYPYMCNEQMASKIKALLSKKRIAEIFGKEYKENKKINDLINRLHKNINPEGLWGWWNRDKTEFWISKQVLSAMLDAEEAGYKTNIDTYTLSVFFEQNLKNALSDSKVIDKRKLHYAKQELLDHLIYLKRMGASIDYPAYFRSIDAQLISHTTTDKLKTMYAMSVIGLSKEINMDSLMQYSRKTMLGAVYWSDVPNRDDAFGIPDSPYKNDIENTLMAYNILKHIGGREDDLVKIRNYFFEKRHGGSWQNTYESSRIIETIMPDMLQAGKPFAETSMYMNEQQITKFPYSENIGTAEPVRIRKSGTQPLFVTAYQQSWNKDPDAETKEGFSVQSYFVVDRDTVSYLTAGKTARLEVEVNIDADANYVQIEIPIPSGCSYETKTDGWLRDEVHREYFKEKVVIFSDKLNKGKHTFTVSLIPRYAGEYHINPAKAEQMYFPTYYGNERQKIIEIR